MVVAELLVKIVRHAGVKDRVRAHPQQRVDVAVHQLGGVADRVGRDRRLPAQVKAARGGRGDDHLVA